MIRNLVKPGTLQCWSFVFLQIFNMSTYQSLADIASGSGDSVNDPNLSSGKYIYMYIKGATGASVL